MLTMEQVKNFAFDVLGDFMPTNAYEVEQDRRGRFQIFVTRPKLMAAPKEVVQEDFARAKAGTEFENVSLFIAM